MAEVESSFAAEASTGVIKIDGQPVCTDEVRGDDPSGVKAYEAAIRWTLEHAPDVAFQWKHLRADTARLLRQS